MLRAHVETSLLLAPWLQLLHVPKECLTTLTSFSFKSVSKEGEEKHHFYLISGFYLDNISYNLNELYYTTKNKTCHNHNNIWEKIVLQLIKTNYQPYKFHTILFLFECGNWLRFKGTRPCDYDIIMVQKQLYVCTIWSACLPLSTTHPYGL